MGPKQDNWPEENKDLEDFTHYSLSELKHVSLHMYSAFLINPLTSSLPSISLSEYFFSRQTRSGPQTPATGPRGLLVRTCRPCCCDRCLITSQGTKISLQTAVHHKLSLSLYVQNHAQHEQKRISGTEAIDAEHWLGDEGQFYLVSVTV